MWFYSFLCIAIGLYPAALYNILPFQTAYQPYTADHLVTQFQLLLFAGFAFFALLPMMKRTLTISLDVDWLYRRLGYRLSTALLEHGSRLYGEFLRHSSHIVNRTIVVMARITGPENVLTRTWVTGNSIMTVTAVLAVLLALFLF